ncbi:MAG TPA: 50S ribosomal protein L10 [Dehalococcoidia bacterium]|nr:50S ribosomal protein L10 [Dehalococcoidia bacterium]
MPTEKKIQAVKEMTETLSRSSVVIGADYRGLTVEEATALRRAMREAGIQIQVVKNTLFLRAAEAAGMPGVGELAEGPTAIIYGFDDPLAPIKTVVEYQRQARNSFQARKAFMDGEIIPAGRLADLASLPPKEVMIAQIVGALQSPITNLVYLLSATLQEFSGLLDARTDQMGDEPSASAPEAAVSEAESPAEASASAADEPAAEAAASEEPTEEPSGSSEENSTEEEAGEEDGN